MKNMSKCDVIITYCWNRVGYNILKSLSRQGLNVWVADTSSYNICSVSKYCAGSFTYPDPFKHEEEFISVLLKHIEELNPKVLLPTHDESVIIAKYRTKFPKDLIIGCDSYNQLVNLSDKKISTEIAAKYNIPVPKVYSNTEEIRDFPIVCKTRIGNSAKGVFFPENRKELYELIQKFGQENLLLEDKVGGVDHSVDCVRFGNFFYATVYRALVTKTEGGGTTTQRILIDCPVLTEHARKILDAVNYQGVCGLDFRYDEESNEAFFIEVNARYTGGLATPIVAGFDIPWIHYSLLTEGKYDHTIQVKTGIQTKWILGDVITLVGRLLRGHIKKEELKQLIDFKFDGFDDWDSSDKKAILGEMSYYLFKLLRNRKLNP